MLVRVLMESDASAYHRLRLRSLQLNPEAFGSTYEREAKFSPETVAERIKPSADKFVLGAFGEQDELIGIVAFVRETGAKTAHKGNVYGMYVAPEARGKGAGKALLLELIERAKSIEGLELLNLAVVSGNQSAVSLYKSLGFETYGVERHALKYEGRYFDEDFMALSLV